MMRITWPYSSISDQIWFWLFHSSTGSFTPIVHNLWQIARTNNLNVSSLQASATEYTFKFTTTLGQTCIKMLHRGDVSGFWEWFCGKWQRVRYLRARGCKWTFEWFSAIVWVGGRPVRQFSSFELPAVVGSGGNWMVDIAPVRSHHISEPNDIDDDEGHSNDGKQF